MKIVQPLTSDHEDEFGELRKAFEHFWENDWEEDLTPDYEGEFGELRKAFEHFWEEDGFVHLCQAFEQYWEKEDGEQHDSTCSSRASQLFPHRDERDNHQSILRELGGLVGLEDVKAQFRKVRNRLYIARKQGMDISKEDFSMNIVGNPGSGKSTIKDLYNRFLKSLDLQGCCTYDPKNPNPPEPTMTLRDYSDEELLRILARRIRDRFKKKVRVEGGLFGLYSRTLVRKVSRSRGTKDFKNVQALDDAFLQVCHRQADRIGRAQRKNKGQEPDYFLFTKEDMIGPEPSDVRRKSAAWQELQSMIGLKDVKESIQTFFNGVQLNYLRELQGKEPVQPALNRVFLGPPGTGKTTVSKLYGQILADLGLLSSGEVVVKNPSDFIAPYLGQSEDRTKAILEATSGKVLIIDDAHMLFPGSRSGGFDNADEYRIAVIDTLVAEIRDVPGQDRCIILTGYPDQMTELFRNCNPGLLRRFPLENAFRLSDFDNIQLGQILDLKLSKRGLKTTSEARATALQVLIRARDRPNFGNGGDVENLLSRAKAAYQKRLNGTSISERAKDVVFKPADFDADFDRASRAYDNSRMLFNNIVGCEDIIALFQDYQQTVTGMRLHGIDPRPYVPFTFLFKGPPGTGKTTVARKVGQLFYDMAFLSSPEVVECSVSDLVAKYTGQTGPKVIELLERALGKVLFVDEAYRLGEGDFAKEAVGELVDCITKTRFQHKMVIVLAGYKEDMDKLMHVNRGLRSRFATDVVFRPMRPEHCLHLLQQRIAELGIQIAGVEHPDHATRAPIITLFRKLAAIKSWANGRDVEGLATTVTRHVFKAEAKKRDAPAMSLTVSVEDLITFLEDMLERAEIEEAEMAISVAPESDANRAGLLNSLGILFFNRYGRAGNADDLDAAISKNKEAVATTPHSHSNRPVYLNNLGNMLCTRYTATGNLDDLEEGISKAEEAMAVMPLSHPDRAALLGNLGNMLSERYKRTEDAADLDAAISNAKGAVAATPPSHSDRAERLSNLGIKLFYRYTRTGDTDDRDAAILKNEEAVAAIPLKHSNRAAVLNNLGSMLSDRYSRTGNPADLDAAILKTEEALAAKPLDHSGRPMYLNNLGNMLYDKYIATGNEDHLEAAISKAEKAVAATPFCHINRPMYLHNLGVKLFGRYARTSYAGDLDAAISRAEEALAATPHSHSDRSMYLDNLGNMLSDRCTATGSADDLDAAISKAEEAVAAMPPSHCERAGPLSNLGTKLFYRYTRTGNTDDLDAAIVKAEEALAAIPVGHSGRAALLNNLGSFLSTRYSRTRNAADLDAAISKTEEALAATPRGHSDTPARLSNLGNMLCDRYKRTGDPKDLYAAISKTQEAMNATPTSHSDRAGRLSNLGTKLLYKYKSTRDAHDLDEAILKNKEAVAALRPDHSDQAGILNNWVVVLSYKFKSTGNAADLQAALQCSIQSSQCSASAPLHRIQGARQALQILAMDSNWDLANDVAEVAMDLLPRACSRFLSRDDQQHAVQQTSGLAADACSVSLRKGDVNEALRRIEFGRGLILGYLIDGQSDLSELGRAHPALATEYERLRFKAFRRVDSDEPAIREQLAQERREASSQLEECESRIRGKQGFEHFLQPPPTEALTACASEGPIVIVNATDIGFDAILVLPSGPKPIALPGLTQRAPEAFQRALGRSRAIDDRDSLRDVGREQQPEHSTAFLTWLWLTCVKPVLQELACYDSSLTSKTAQRIWWIGTGAASSLPFHAACEYDGGSIVEGESCLDQAISSYTPTIKALGNARKRSLAAGTLNSEDTSVLVVTMPTTPGQSALSGVAREEQAVTEAVKQTYTVRPPLRHPTAEQVLRGIRESEIAHFACHGFSDLVDPSSSHLLLQKEGDPDPVVDRLTVSALLGATAQGRAWLAYLSACSTAETRVESLADESIHMASGFQIAGFAHVIGSLWPANDDVCVQVAELFYRRLVGGGGIADPDRAVATALRDAVLQVRQRYAGDPGVWALYIHLGA